MQKPLLLLLTLLVFTFNVPASAQNTPLKLILILDASGSMWEQIEGGHKIVIARKVLKDLVSGISDEAQVGVVTYGHRNKGDCADIETLVPLSKVDKTALTAKVDALNPLGKTPITDAIKQALEMVKGQSEETTIVLLSDGLETCGGDPCKTVTEARKAGIKIVMHVIGFDVGKVDASQLECTAQAGGGLYLSASNADELSDALNQTVAAPEIPNSRISVKAVADGKLTDVSVHVFKAGTKNEVAGGRSYSAPETNPRVMPVPAGSYDIEVTAVKFKGNVSRSFKAVQVAENETVEKVVDFSTGELSVRVTRNGELSDATVNVYVAGTRERVAGGRTYNAATSNPKIMQITPGNYDIVVGSVEVAGKPERKFENVVVEPGARTEHTVAFDSGALRIGAVQGRTLVDATVNVYQEGNRRAVAAGRTYTAATSNPKEFTLPVGEYRVVVKPVKISGAQAKEINVVVKQGEVVERKVEF